MTEDRKAWRPETVLVLVAAALALPYNLMFWSRVLAAQPPHGLHGMAFLVAVALVLTAAFSLLLMLLPLRYVGRPLLTLLLPVAALTAYFMGQYGVAVDELMIQNVFETDTAEVAQLVSLKMIGYLLGLGVLPVVLLWRAPLRRAQPWPALRARLLAMATGLLVIAVAAAIFYSSFASLLRNNRELRFYLVPNNFLNGLRNYAGEAAGPAGPLTAIGTDARPGAMAKGKQKPTVVVLVIGETARGDHFSLNGYARDTNPALSRQAGLVNFSDAHSCGTETAVSLPCMLSGLGRENFSVSEAGSSENLLDVVRRAGVDVVWVENQSGCKRTCDRVKRVYTNSLKLPGYCQDGECHDEILVEALRQQLDTATRDTLVVLHQMGSHGPAYYLRYPVPAFEKFTPVCKTNLLDQCTADAIRNTYDNTILYTDHVLSKVVDTLRGESRYDTAFLYFSDHGESLGEYGLYLHGAPRMLAPEAQVHIPAMAWLSDNYQKATGITSACLARRSGDAITHDNLFHSVLGLLDINTQVYEREKDLFGTCSKSIR